MLGPIALVGGGEFRPDCREMDITLLRASGAMRSRVVIVPTAAAHERPDLAARNGVAYFRSLGAEPVSVMAIDAASANNPEVLAPIGSADLLYFTGGSPMHLLQVLETTRLRDEVLAAWERGALLAGSSAGAMALGEWMLAPGTSLWSPALAVVRGVGVLPHFERWERDRIERARAARPQGAVLLGILGATAVLTEPETGRGRVVGIGNVTVIDGAGVREVAPGGFLPLPS